MLLSLLLAVSVLAPGTPDADPALTATMRARDQLLLDAVHNGNKAAWREATTPDFLYVEEGEIIPRAEFLDGLEADGSRPLLIRDYQVRVFGDLMLIVHHDDVPVELPARGPGAQYVMTETWQKTDGQWKLHLIHLDAVHTEPPAITLSAKQLDELTGTYRSGDYTYTLKRDGNRLVATRNGGKPVEFKPETRDVFFLSGDLRSRRIFERDAEGNVTGFVRRDENSSTLWSKVR